MTQEEDGRGHDVRARPVDLPEDLRGGEVEDLTAGIEDELAAHGPLGDADIPTRGADGQGLPHPEEEEGFTIAVGPPLRR